MVFLTLKRVTSPNIFSLKMTDYFLFPDISWYIFYSEGSEQLKWCWCPAWSLIITWHTPMWKNPKFGSQKISSFVIKKPYRLWDLTYFNKLKFSGNFRSGFKNWIDRFVAMVIKDLQTLNLESVKSCLTASFLVEKKFWSDVWYFHSLSNPNKFSWKFFRYLSVLN